MKMEQAVERGKSDRIWFVFFVSICLVLNGCSHYDAAGITDVGEKPVYLYPANVEITEEQYQQFAAIQGELKNIILEGRDPGKLADLYALFPQNDFRKAGSCYLSSIPLIEWDYENNSIYQIRLLAFSEDQSVCFFILIDYHDGKMDYQNGGYENMRIEFLQRYPDQKFVCLKADYYQSCLLSADNHVFPGDEMIIPKKDFSAQFDFARMGVCYQEATDRNVCIEVDFNE